MRIPKTVDIENVRGLCNSRCPMCSLDRVQGKKIMTLEEGKRIIDALAPYADRIENLQFVGIGEPSLDDSLVEKVAYARQRGFANIGVVTNAGGELARYEKILRGGPDFLLMSIDSIHADQYQAIRKNLDYQCTLGNILRIIALRDESKLPTKLFVRAIIGEENQEVWPEYAAFWSGKLDLAGGDLILHFPQHNWADAEAPIEKTEPCVYPFEHMTVTAHGDLQFCCIDFNADFFPIGNVLETDPMELYNGPVFARARELMSQGRINELDACRFCNVPLKRSKRGMYTP